MAEPVSSDFDLTWYLHKLNKKEFHTLLDLIRNESLERGLPPIQRRRKEELVNLLATYETQHVWNIMFSIFQKMNRKDLCDKITARRNRSKEMHRVLMKEKLMHKWEKHYSGYTENEFYKDLREEILKILDFIYSSTQEVYSKDSNLFVLGEQGVGKTLVITWAVLEWAKGSLWKDMFSYIVFITSHEINQMGYISLVDLISRDWPNGQAPVADILSDSKELLFIVEDLDNVDMGNNINSSNLCVDSRDRVCPSFLLASLLRRKMTPDASFLISLRSDSEASLLSMVQALGHSMMMGLSSKKREKYFTDFFEGGEKAEIAYQFVQDNEVIMSLCLSPALCWVTGMALQRQMDQRVDVKHSLQTPTDIYAHFLTNSLTSEAGDSAGHSHLGLLGRLCSLAAEGLYCHTLHFCKEDLCSVGFTEAEVHTLQALMILLPSSRCGDYYMFQHLKIQEFCAALAHMMTLRQWVIHSARRRIKEKRERYEDFTHVAVSVCGLLNESRRKIIEVTFGCHLLTWELKNYILEKMIYLGNHPEAMNHHMPVFYCLYENREEEFVNQIINSFTEVTIYMKENKDMLISLYCLQRCHTLQKLRLGIQHIFEYKKRSDVPLSANKVKSLIYWRDLCSLLHTKETLQELEISNAYFDDTSERILCKALQNPSCRIQTFKLAYLPTSFKFESIFNTLAQIQSLTFLGLTYISISCEMMSLIQDLWQDPLCHMQHLSLTKCELSLTVYDGIALLINSKKLKKLSLISIQMNNEEVKILSKALDSPDCPLESLTLVYCSLNSVGCNYIAKTFMKNRTLKHLDLSVNKIQDHGVLFLTLPLSFPICNLQELELCGCMITSDITHNIASMAITSPNLKSMELGSNHFGNRGLANLCEALEDDSCKLENLGIEECNFTSAASRVLILALMRNKTLKRLNLIGNNMGNKVIAHILLLLNKPRCSLQTIGLPVIKKSARIASMLSSLKEKKPHLTFIYETWAKKEGRTIDEVIGEPRPPDSVPKAIKRTWDVISRNMPRKFMPNVVPE